MGETLARRGDLAAPPAPPLILASTSPRRREILEQLRIPFDVVVPQYEETQGDPVEHALGKARSVGAFDDRPVLGCDTEVICGGRVYGKPENEEDAAAMLESLAGRTHEVVSGVALITLGASLVERIEGDYLNVVGLPGALLVSLLAKRFAGVYGFG